MKNFPLSLALLISLAASQGAAAQTVGSIQNSAIGNTVAPMSGLTSEINRAEAAESALKATANAAVPSSTINVAGGVAGLDANGLVLPAHLPAATTSALGAVQVGTGLGVSAGTMSVQYGTTVGTAAAGNDSRIVGALQGANNLSDLKSPTTARSNLGLGSAALFPNATSGPGLCALTQACRWSSPNVFGVGNTNYAVDTINIMNDPNTNISAEATVAFINLEATPSVPTQGIFTIGSSADAQVSATQGSFSTTTTAASSPNTNTITVSSTAGLANNAVIIFAFSDGTPYGDTISSISGDVVTLAQYLPTTSGVNSGTTVYIAYGHLQGSISVGDEAATVTGVGPFGVEGAEYGANVAPGAAPPMYKADLAVGGGGGQVDGVAGLFYDAGISRSNATGDVGMKNGILFSPVAGQGPVQSSGTLIATSGPAVVANGIDFSSYTFSGDFLKSNGFTVDRYGNADAASYSVGARTGVTCTGAPTSSYAVTNGIVTHC